jgi:hypothetical protein
MADGIEEPTSTVAAENEQRQRKVRRFAGWVTALMIVVCNAVFLLGVWGTGFNLDRLIRFPDIYNPAQDICLRLTWHRVIGSDEPVRLCSEWVQLSDPSGQTHSFHKETKVVQGADGKLYFDHGARVDYHLFVFVVFVTAVVASGILLQRYLIARYRVRLETASSRSSRI